MPELMQCDECGTLAVEDHTGWWRVEYASEVATFATDTRDKTFCSWGCLRFFATRRHAVEPWGA